MTTHTTEPLLTPRQVAEYLGRSIGSLAQLRYLGRGPRYIKTGNTVRYRRLDIEQWLSSGVRTHT